jgi:hypothetical protein
MLAQRAPHGRVLGLPPALFQAAHCLAQGGQKQNQFPDNLKSQCTSDWKEQKPIGH